MWYLSLLSQRLPRLNTVKPPKVSGAMEYWSVGVLRHRDRNGLLVTVPINPLLQHSITPLCISVVRVAGFFVVLANQHGEHRGQQHKDEGLHKPDEQFHEIKGNGQQPAEDTDECGQHYNHAFGV